jgi:glycine/D-amino acid oxidase-like deaminating enzyme
VGLPFYELKGSLYYAAYKKHISFLKEEYEARKRSGFKVSYLDAGAVKDQYGFNAPAAIFSDHGAQTDAYLFTHCLHQYNIKKGAQVFDRSAVVKITEHKNAVKFWTAEGNRIDAKKIVYATGYEVVQFIKKPVVKLKSTYAVASEHFEKPVSFWKGNAMMWNTADPYFYMSTTPDDRIIIGGRDENFSDATKRNELIDQKSIKLVNDFKKLFPHISFVPEFKWAGTFGSTKDGLPYIGTYKENSHSYFALGFGGNGIIFSQVAGEIIADIIKGKKNKDAAIFSFART